MRAARKDKSKGTAFGMTPLKKGTHGDGWLKCQSGGTGYLSGAGVPYCVRNDTS